MAIAALICAILFAPLGIILGHVARSQMRRTGEGGWGLATAALIIGYIFTLIPLAIVAAFAVLIATGANDREEQPQIIFPTVTETGTAPGYSYRLPLEPAWPATERLLFDLFDAGQPPQ